MSNARVIHWEQTLNGSYVGVVHCGDGDDYMAFTLEINRLLPELKIYHPEVLIPTVYSYHDCFENEMRSIEKIIDNDKPKITHCEECMGKGHTNDGSLGSHNCEACKCTGIKQGE